MVQGTCYIAGLAEGASDPYTLPMTDQPSEQYLCAVHGMLRQNWPGDEDKYNPLQIESYELRADGKYEVCNISPPQIWYSANCLNVLFEMPSCLCETVVG